MLQRFGVIAGRAYRAVTAVGSALLRRLTDQG